jgi:hypothetical protein
MEFAMTNRYTVDPANFCTMVNNAFVTTRDHHLIREFGEDAGLSFMPIILGGVIGYMFRILSESEAREKLVADVNQALERTGAQYRLRMID